MTHATAPVLLATDLDGTFLAGNSLQRRQLYRLLAAQGAAWTARCARGE